MIRAVIEILGARLDMRILSASSHCGRSIVYLRLDIGLRTALMLDLERVSREYRSSAAVEYLARLGPWQNTNRSYYVG